MNRRPSGRPKKVGGKIWTSILDIQSANHSAGLKLFGLAASQKPDLQPRSQGSRGMRELRAGPACPV